jgi:hypothetical protein
VGGHPYWYIVPYQSNLQSALDDLRQREFKAGRYNPVVPFPEFPVEPDSPAPGAQHSTIDEALEDSDADGTRSILDIMRIGDSPDYSTASPVDAELLEEVFGTTRPTREMIEDNMDFLEDIERGQAAYIILYASDKPSEILFAGYSFD